MANFSPKALPPEDLTAALRQGMADIPRATSPAPATTPSQPVMTDDPPLQAAPPDDVPKRFTSFRLPVDLDEELRAMMFETRRSKQDLLTEFTANGIRAWRQSRTRKVG
jgi:hypothetical protein